MEILKSVLSIIFYLITNLCFYKIISCFVTIRNSVSVKIMAFAGMFIIPNIIIYSADIVNIACAMITFVVIMLLFFDGDFMKKISVVMILYPIVVSLNFLTKSVLAKLYFTFGEIVWVNYCMHFLKLAINCTAWFLIYIFAKRKIQNTGKYVDKKTWLMIDIICLAPLISIIIVLINTPMGNEFKVYPIAAACLTTNIGVLFLVEYIIKSVETGLENQNLKLEYSYYKELEENQLEIRKIRHDMNNHLSVIHSFLLDEKIEDAKRYFSSLLDKFSVNGRVFCKNSILNAVINSKYNMAVKNQIDCFFNIDINNELPIEDIDLCSIFANTLDNAIEASLEINEVSQRKIITKARCDKGYFSYSITNNYSTEIKLLNSKYLTNKPDNKMHGFGLENVKDIVKKYNGTLDISFTEAVFSIIIAIRIN